MVICESVGCLFWWMVFSRLIWISWSDAGIITWHTVLEVRQNHFQKQKLWTVTLFVEQAGCFSNAHEGTGCGQRGGWHPKQTVKILCFCCGGMSKMTNSSARESSCLRSPGAEWLNFTSCLTHLKSRSPRSCCMPFSYLNWSSVVHSFWVISFPSCTQVTSSTDPSRGVAVVFWAWQGIAHLLLLTGSSRQNLLEC